jgi:soluble lytic murein transglycosylase
VPGRGAEAPADAFAPAASAPAAAAPSATAPSATAPVAVAPSAVAPSAAAPSAAAPSAAAPSAVSPAAAAPAAVAPAAAAPSAASPFAASPSAVAPSAAALAAFGARAGPRRAVMLAGLGMKPESLREWIQAIRGQDDDGLLVAAEFARRQKLYDRAINTAERTVARHDFGLRYLMPYREHFAAAARDNGIDEAILLAIARQESRFAVDIVSSAGAVGLMQLMPATAGWVARKLGRTDYRPTEIGDVATNTQFGAFYFKYWFDRLERLPALAAAAYNAGPKRAQAWRTGAPLEGAIWVETIPFNETRDYVKKVLANMMYYARELDAPYLPLAVRLGTIPPQDDGSGAAVAAQAD